MNKAINKEKHNTIDKNCKNCNKEFTVYKSMINQQCCSKECSWKFKYNEKHPHAKDGLKTCYKCRELKELDKFPKLKVSVDGRRGTCNKCWDKQYPYIGQTEEQKLKTRNWRLKNEYNIDQDKYIEMYNK